eukprot:scaffold22494_cov18-Tisochrysis_lutea.AAC.1
MSGKVQIGDPGPERCVLVYPCVVKIYFEECRLLLNARPCGLTILWGGARQSLVRSMSGAAGVQSGPGDEEVGRSEQVCAGTYTLPERHLPTSSNGQQATL